MKIPARMRQIVYDTQPLNPEGATTFFSDDAGTLAPSAAEWSEDTLLTWLLSRWQFRMMLCEELELSEQVCWRMGVKAPFLRDTNRKPGDIDLLLAVPERPQAAVAFETKRVKVRPGSQGPQTITKLLDFGKGIPQANGLLECGFSRTYLTMLAVVDGRGATESNFVFRGLDPEGVRHVLETPAWDTLREEVGVLYVELVQPVDRSVDAAGTIRLAHLRAAHLKEQSVDTTSRIVRFFEFPA